MAALPPIVGRGSEAWHTLMVAGSACPGVAIVKPKRGYKVDKKSGLGEDGGTLTIQGKDVPGVSVTVRVWKQQQLEELAALIGTLFPSGSAIADPVKVSHPVLAIVGVTALFFESVDGPAQTEPGLWEATFAASEFKPARAAGAGGSPTSATGVSAKQKKAMKAAEAANRAGVINKVVAASFKKPPGPSTLTGGSWY